MIALLTDILNLNSNSAQFSKLCLPKKSLNQVFIKFCALNHFKQFRENLLH